ncbi:dephospho-CoA kinase [Leifsonia kafniensis]|uniref:Dephospho-CoA kinase n=1 Tax=Leifsonia kafniensis TaxID=475957 RepID=A0ABP7K6B6_9MICO
MYLIGLTGGIAAGKSTVATRLVEHGAVHIDADKLARAVVEPGTPGLAAVRETFGDGVIRADGSLDRAALGAQVFSNPAELDKLNGIVHPAVRALSDSLIRDAAADQDVVVVYDVPLLVEASTAQPHAHPFDLVVVVHASEETRLRRMVELRGMSETDAANRINSQATDAERLAVADVVIDTDGSLDDTLAQVDALWTRVRAAVVSAG